MVLLHFRQFNENYSQCICASKENVWVGWDPIGSVLAYSTYAMLRAGPPNLHCLNWVWWSFIGNPCPKGRRSRKLKDQGHPWLPREFETSLGYFRDLCKCVYISYVVGQRQREQELITSLLWLCFAVCCVLFQFLKLGCFLLPWLALNSIAKDDFELLFLLPRVLRLQVCAPTPGFICCLISKTEAVISRNTNNNLYQ